MTRSTCHKRLSRREFLHSLGVAAAGALVASCQKEQPTSPPESTLPVGKETGSAARVAIAKAESYDPKLIRQQVRDVLDRIGGLGDVIHSGDRVAIKTNLTGGTSAKPLPGVLAIESYITHPEVVHALGECVRDAGARELYIVESVYEWDSYKLWGYEEVAEALGATLIDLNDTKPYTDFASVPVGENSYIYEKFTFNHILEEVDAFISVPKMKCHYSCGVTHSLKNLVGLAPLQFYRRGAKDTYRSGFHGTDEEMGTRLPRVIIDLNRARPIHLALIDGIKSTDGGEGPWVASMSPVQPGVLIAGKDPVATDAVATAAQDFDPLAGRGQSAFLRSDNHLNLASERGLGTNRLDEIEVLGLQIADIRYKFKPASG